MLRVKQKLLTDVNDRAYSIVLKKKILLAQPLDNDAAQIC